MGERFSRSVPVCPPCSRGDHDHHDRWDCKNLIPEGQCHCRATTDNVEVSH